MQHKRMTSGRFLATGIALLTLLGALPYASAQGQDPDVSVTLLREIRQLRVEMAGLKTEISKLRAELAGKSSKAEGEARATGTALQPNKLTIEFTEVPQGGKGPESRGNIAGRVVGLTDPESYKLVIYAHTDWWYVQPLISSPFTSVQGDGKWSTWTHLGDRYAALVVRPCFRPADKVQSLPPVCADVLAVAEVPAAGN